MSEHSGAWAISPISDDKLAVVRKRAFNQWPMSSTAMTIKRLDLAEAKIERLQWDIGMAELILSKVQVNGMSWAEFRRRLDKIAPKATTDKEMP